MIRTFKGDISIKNVFGYENGRWIRNLVDNLEIGKGYLIHTNEDCGTEIWKESLGHLGT